jgi:hypothetical protein
VGNEHAVWRRSSGLLSCLGPLPKAVRMIEGLRPSTRRYQRQRSSDQGSEIALPEGAEKPREVPDRGWKALFSGLASFDIERL